MSALDDARNLQRRGEFETDTEALAGLLGLAQAEALARIADAAERLSALLALELSQRLNNLRVRSDQLVESTQGVRLDLAEIRADLHKVTPHGDSSVSRGPESPDEASVGASGRLTSNHGPCSADLNALFPNPLSSEALSKLQVVLAANFGEGKPNLLGPVSQEVDGGREFANLRVGVGLEPDGDLRCPLAVDDPIQGDGAAALHGDSSVSRGPESPDEASVGASGRRGDDSGLGVQGGRWLSPEVLDELAIITVEVQGIAHDDVGNATAVATIRQAAFTLDRILGNGKACARLTHTNGYLNAKYRDARARFVGQRTP